MIPDPEKPETFRRSKLKWNEINQGEHAEMLEWYRALIHLRRTEPSLNDGEPRQTRVLYDQQEMWFSIERGDIGFHCNLGDKERLFPLPKGAKVVLSSQRVAPVKNGAVMLPTNSVVIVSSESRRN